MGFVRDTLMIIRSSLKILWMRHFYGTSRWAMVQCIDGPSLGPIARFPDEKTAIKCLSIGFFSFFFFFLPPPTLISLFCMVFVQDCSLHGVCSGYPDDHMKVSQDPMDPPF